MVALGRLDRLWSVFPEKRSEKEFGEEFKAFFGKGWKEILDTVENSFDYISFNDVYFSVSGVRTVEGLTLDKLLETEDIKKPLNIVVS